MEYYLAVTIGALIYMGLQLNGVYNCPEFKWRTFFKTNWIPTLLNVIIGFALIIIKDTYVESLRGALITGFSGQVILKKIADVFDKNKDTLIKL